MLQNTKDVVDVMDIKEIPSEQVEECKKKSEKIKLKEHAAKFYQSMEKTGLVKVLASESNMTILNDRYLSFFYNFLCFKNI